MAGVFVVTNKDKFFEQMRLEHNKSEKEYEQCLDILSEWADTQKHFPEKPDRYILRYVLLSNKFSIERSKEKLDMYYSVRNLMPEIFSKHPLSPEFIKESRVNYAIPMPKPGPGYKRIVYCQHNPEFGAEYFYPEKFFTHILHVAELIFHTDDCCNYHFIYDCNGLTLGHVPRFSLVVMKKVGFLLDKVFSNRMASIYLVNFHPYMEHIVNHFFKPFLIPKLRERFYVHAGTNILLEVFGKSHMPKDIGGDEPSLAELNDVLLKTFEKHKDRFDKIQGMKVDEDLRPEKLENDEILGFYGNFRNISVD